VIKITPGSERVKTDAMQWMNRVKEQELYDKKMLRVMLMTSVEVKTKEQRKSIE
jgi:hypothetical protein